MVEQDQEHVVSDVELIILNFVVWAPVLAFSELMVAPSIFIAVPPDGGRDGCSVAKVIIIAIGRIRLVLVVVNL